MEEKITDKTKAIIAVHLTGGPTDMDAIMDIAHRHNLKIIEDCAQSYMATYKGKLLGTIGDVGCFSLNDFKQISAGDGGLVVTRSEEMYEAALRFADKNYQRLPWQIRSLARCAVHRTELPHERADRCCRFGANGAHAEGLCTSARDRRPHQRCHS